MPGTTTHHRNSNAMVDALAIDASGSGTQFNFCVFIHLPFLMGCRGTVMVRGRSIGRNNTCNFPLANSIFNLPHFGSNQDKVRCQESEQLRSGYRQGSEITKVHSSSTQATIDKIRYLSDRVLATKYSKANGNERIVGTEDILIPHLHPSDKARRSGLGWTRVTERPETRAFYLTMR